MANNSTCDFCLEATPSNNPGDGYLWAAFVVVLAIVVCNMIPLVVMARNIQIRKHRFFRFLICLSINAILTSPFLFTSTVFRNITPVDDFSKIRIYFDCMLLQSYMHHGIIALERFFASGSHNDSYRRYFTSRRQVLYLVLSYIIVIIFATVVVAINYDFDENNPLNVYGRNHDFILFIYGCSVLLLLLVVTILSSCCTYRVVMSYLYWAKAVQPLRSSQLLQVPLENVQCVRTCRPPTSMVNSFADGSSSSTWAGPASNTRITTVNTVSNIKNDVFSHDCTVHSIDTKHQNSTSSKHRMTTGRRPLGFSTASKSKRSVAIIKTFLLALFVVLCFNVPYWLTRVIIYLDRSAIAPASYRVTFIITGAQYAMNPVIYFFRIDLFRKALFCSRHRRNN